MDWVVFYVENADLPFLLHMKTRNTFWSFEELNTVALLCICELEGAVKSEFPEEACYC